MSKERGCMPCCIGTCGLAIVLLIIIFLAKNIIEEWKDDRDANFKLESISVTFQQNNVTKNNTSDTNDAVASWNIGISIRNSNRKSYFYFREFNVWIRYMSESTKSTSSQAAIPPFEQGCKNTTVVYAKVETVLSPSGRLKLMVGTIVDVVLQVKYTRRRSDGDIYDGIFECVNIGFSSNATLGGAIVGGQKWFDQVPEYLPYSRPRG